MTVSTARRAARGGLITLAGQAAKLALLLLNLVVLGRLLTPLDFGLVAMVTAVVGVAELVRDFGITTASIQVKYLSRSQKNNLFWTNVTLGLLLAGAAALLSQPLAAFYGDARLQAITLAFSGIFILNGVQAQYQVELTRLLRFKTLTITDVASNATGLCIAVITAMLGAGYWSLIFMQLSTAAFLLLSRVTFTKWIPGLPDRQGSITDFLRYGGNLGFAQFVNYLSANAPSVLIGYAFGPGALGAYSRASQIASLPVNQVFGPLTNVALTTLVPLLDRRKFNRAIRVMQLLLGYVASIGFSFAIVFAPNIVKLLLGDQWSSASPLLQILAVGTTFQATTYVSYWVFLATSRTASLLRYNLVTKGIVLTLTIIGTIWGAHGMVWGYSVGLITSWPISLLWMRTLGVPIEALLYGGIRFIGVGAAGATAGLLAPRIFVSIDPLGASALGWALGLSLALAFPQVRADLRLTTRTLKNIRQSKTNLGGPK
ncbi:lipopolysaccharide biosynthesis protein [Arthrobacter sp. NPDC057013]